jgi:very-short-patch-repair endonuclease
MTLVRRPGAPDPEPIPRLEPFRGERWDALFELAGAQAGVLSRPQLYDLGVTRAEVRAHLRAGRWRHLSDQAVAIHNGRLDLQAHLWAAVLQGGPRAQLDGAASLVASGLQRFTVDRVRVSVPRGARVRRTRRYDIRQTRRWSADDRVPTGVPRTRVPVAAVRAAIWAVSDKQAALVLMMVVQQGLASPGQLGQEVLRIRRDKRRLLLHLTVADLLDGARALGEVDVTRELRRRGLPVPQQQVLRKDRKGRYYLDLYWPDLGVVVEIDGIHHAWAENVVGDALRQNSLALAGDTVLRLPLLGLRLQPDEFFDQIAQALDAAARRRAA